MSSNTIITMRQIMSALPPQDMYESLAVASLKAIRINDTADQRIPTLKEWIRDCRNQSSLNAYKLGGKMVTVYSCSKSITSDKCIAILDAYLEKRKAEISIDKDSIGEMVSRSIPKGSTLIVHGDIHTQIYSLFERLDWMKSGEQQYLDDYYHIHPDSQGKTRILILGDYFGRGYDGLMLFLSLLLLKLENWESVDLYRGNHEALNMIDDDKLDKMNNLLTESTIREKLKTCFSTLLLRGYYHCEDGEQGKREHIVCAHGVPGLFPFARDVIGKGSVVVSKKCPPISERTFKKELEKTDDATREAIGRFYSRNYPLFDDELNQGKIPDIWADIIQSIVIPKVSHRGCSFSFPPAFYKSICRFHSTKDDRIVALFKGHGHERNQWSYMSKKGKEKIFIHQLPTCGENPQLRGWVEGVDAFYVVSVNGRKIRDWKLSIVEKKPGDCFHAISSVEEKDQPLYDVSKV